MTTPCALREPASMGLDRGLLILLVVSLALNVTGIWWGLPPNGYFAWDVDGIAPLQPLVAAKRMFVDDWWNSGYYNKFPMGHFFVLMAAYAPYLGYLWLTGGLRNPSEVYPFGFSDPETALTVLSLIARGISALMGVGIVALVYLTVRRLAGQRAAFFAGFTVAVSPAFIFYAHTGNVDTPSVFWAALALFAFGRLVDGECRARNYLLLGGAVGMALATKEQAIGLFLLLPVSLVILHVEHAGAAVSTPATLLRAAGDRKLLGGFAASIATFVVATHLIFNWDGNLLRLRWRVYREHPAVGTEYPRNVAFDGPLEGLQQIAANTWDIMNPVLFLAGVAGLVALPWRHRWARHFAVPLVSYVVVIVLILDFFRARFVMQVALVLACFAGPVLAALWTAAVRRSRVLALPIVAVCVYAFVYGAEVDYLLVRDARYDVEAWLRREAPPGGRVEVYTGGVYLPRFPTHVAVEQREFTPEDLENLTGRGPDLVVLTSVHYSRLTPDTPEGAWLTRLLRGELDYRPIGVFRRDPVVSPRMIRSLSPEIVVLGRRPGDFTVLPMHVQR